MLPKALTAKGGKVPNLQMFAAPNVAFSNYFLDHLLSPPLEVLEDRAESHSPVSSQSLEHCLGALALYTRTPGHHAPGIPPLCTAHPECLSVSSLPEDGLAM